ncbi:MAG TPA: DUF456 domain-containing protein [Nocardioides sp.]|nr:DUF456 domain-containing protein [Nocardioides sp.]
MSLTEVLVGIAIALGLIGVVVPILPGSVLVLLAVLLWSIWLGTATGWVVFAVAAVFLLAGTVVKYAVPGRQLKDAGIPASTQWTGVALAVPGFFVIPVVGLFVGFVAGVYLAERQRLGAGAAWPSTRSALRAVGVSILIELAAAVLAATAWVVGVMAT